MEPVRTGADEWLARWLRDYHLRVCTLVSVVFVLMPPDGLPNFDICVYKRYTNAPCPGCGITRSGSNLVRGDFRRMFNYNPFGIVIVPLIFVLGLLGVMPLRVRDAVRRRLSRHAGFLQASYWTVIGAFLVFGLIRWYAVFQGWLDFPANWL